jgi:hypothetical protein
MSKSHDLDPDPPLSYADEALVRSLSAETVAIIDAALLRETLVNWRKVAMVVARTIEAVEGRVVALPDVYFAQRVRYLVASGKLDSQGDLSRMRYSEVRLVGTAAPIL